MAVAIPKRVRKNATGGSGTPGTPGTGQGGARSPTGGGGAKATEAARLKPAAVSPRKVRVEPARVREELGLKQPEFARMTGYSTRSVAGWEAGQPVSPSAQQRLVEMDRLREGLARVMAAAHVGEWLNSPNPAFGGQTPLQVVERGEADRLWRMIFELEAGVAT